MIFTPPVRETRRGGRHQQGVSLIEVLIALLLVAFGTLAIVLLQLSSKRSNLDAAQRAAAAQIGDGFLERIRGNNTPAGLTEYQTRAAGGYGGGVQAAPATGANCGAGDDCTPEELARYDSWQFERELDGAAELVGTTKVGGVVKPTACLSANPAGGESANFTLTIAWRGAGQVQDNDDVACGKDLVQGGVRVYGDNDEFRRTLTLSAFIARREP